MSTEWTWTYYDAEGNVLEGPALAATRFPTQSDAESWLGEEWRGLLDLDVEAVTLREGDTVVYGPMSLRAAQ